MKKTINKIIKKFETSTSSKKVSVTVFKCDCCDDYLGSILNKKTGFTFRKDIKSLSDYVEFCDVFNLLTDDYLPSVSLISNGYNLKKADKIMNTFFDELEKEDLVEAEVETKQYEDSPLISDLILRKL